MKKIWEYLKNRQALTNLLVVCSGIAFYMLLKHFSSVCNVVAGFFSVIAPFIWGCIIAYLLSPVSHFFMNRIFGRMKRRKAARVLAVTITFLLALCVIALILIAVIPQLLSSVSVLLKNMDGYFESFKSTLQGWTLSVPFLSLDVEALVGTWSQAFAKIVQWLTDNGDGIIGGAMQVGSSVLDFALALILSVYILLDEENILSTIRRCMKALFGMGRYARLSQFTHRSNRIFMRYVGSNLLDSLIVGAANFLFMMILGIPYPLLITIIVALTNLIPTFGPIIGAIPSLILILIINPVQALWFLIFTIILQLLDGNLIKPLLFGDTTGLRPVWVLLAIIIGGRLFGMIGMLLGIPIFAILSFVLDEAINKRLTERGLDVDGNATKDAADANGSEEAPEQDQP